MMRSVCLVVLLFVISPFSAIAQQGWYPVHVPGGYTDVDIANDSELAVLRGYNTSVSHDGGKTWPETHLLHHPGNYYLYTIKLLPPDTLVLFGRGVISGYPQWITRALIYRSFDQGNTWHPGDIGDYHTDFELDVMGHTTPRWTYGFYNYNYPSVFFSPVWDGSTNRELQSIGNGIYLQNMQFASDSIGMSIASDDYRTYEKVFVTKDGGNSWKEGTARLKAVWPNAPVVRPGPAGSWYISNDSELLVSRDTGSSWSRIHLFDRTINQFQFFDSIGYAVLLDADYIMKTTDAGKSWFAQSSYNGRDPITYVVPTSNHVAYAWAEGKGSDDFMRIDDSTSISGPVLSANRIINFGSLPPDSIATRTIVIRNVGAKTLNVSGFISDSANVSFTPKAFSVVAGSSIPITISYSTRNGAGDDIRFRILTNTAPQSEVFHVNGSALLPAFSYSSHFIDFGEVQIGERQTKKIRISNIGKTQAIFRSPLAQSFLFYSTTPDSLNPGSSEIFSVRFAPELPLTYDAKLIIRTNAASWDTLTLHGTGVMIRSGQTHLVWEKSYELNDTLRGTATNMLLSGPNEPLVSGVVSEDDSTRAVIVVQYDAFGNRLLKTVVDAGRSELDIPTAIASDSLGGTYLAYTQQKRSTWNFTHRCYWQANLERQDQSNEH